MPEHAEISKEWIPLYGALCHVLGMAYVLARESVSLALVQLFSDPKALRELDDMLVCFGRSVHIGITVMREEKYLTPNVPHPYSKVLQWH